MANVKSEYKVENNLDMWVVNKMSEMMVQRGEQVQKVEVLRDLGEFCGVGVESLKKIIRNSSQPSLVVALRIASYFDLDVSDIFTIENNHDDV